MLITTWPPSMLPNNRIARVSGRAKYEIISIGTMKISSGSGMPED